MRRDRFRLAAVVGALVASLLLAEGVLRIAALGTQRREGQPQIEGMGEGLPFFRITPSTEFTHVWDGDPYGTLPEGARLTYRIDPGGYRSDGASVGATDVVVLGDSFTFGEGVEVGARFSDLLGRGATYNAGVPGWSTLDQVAVLPELLATHAPRAVLLVAQPNDAIPLPHAQNHVDGDFLALEAAVGWSRLWATLRAGARTRATEEWYRSYWTGERSEFGRECLAALRDADALCRARGVGFGVAMFPLLHRLDAYPFEDVHAVVAESCRRDGIAFVDLLPALRDEPAETLWVHPSDHHPNARAHRLAADALVDFVVALRR